MKRLLLCLLALMSVLNCSRKPYVIVQVADAQLGFTAADSCHRAGIPYVNDLTYESQCLEKAVLIINDMAPDAVIFTGDQVNASSDTLQWDMFAEIISHISDDVKVFHLPGNHDVVISGDKVDSTPFTERYGEDRFLHRERGVRIVGVNTNLIKSNDPREGEQLDWMRTALKKESPDEVTLVFGHHPYFMTGIDEPDSYFPIMTSKRYLYFDLFAEMDVDAVYAGHRHDSYESGYNGIPMKTTTSVAFQIGNSRPSIRIITISGSDVTDELIEI